MSGWRLMLKADPTEWLLGEDNPSVRYFTLTDVLERNMSDPDVEESKEAIMQTGAVPRILAKQKNGGYWGVAEDFYVAKYEGTVWQLMVLAELGADSEEPHMKKTCEFVLNGSQDRLSGGFSPLGASSAGGTHDGVLPCLTGNMVWSLIRHGYLNDACVQRGIE